MKPGESVKLSDAKVTIRFESVLEDSRCPTGGQCVWAGNARVLLQVAADGGKDEAVQLNTNRGDKAATVGGYRVTLVKVEPQRVSSRSIAPADYRLTISLNRV